MTPQLQATYDALTAEYQTYHEVARTAGFEKTITAFLALGELEDAGVAEAKFFQTDSQPKGHSTKKWRKATYMGETR